jgi:hypothetical protein
MNFMSAGVAELAKAFAVQPRDSGSNLGKDRKYILFCLCFNSSM